MSLTTRNAGFATLNMNDMSETVQALFGVLMFLGSSPNSAGGGIRTTTFLLTILGIYSFSRGKDQVVIKKKSIKSETVYKSMFVVIGALGLWGGSELLIKGATTLAKDFGVTDRVIAVTVVSIGTSVPELAASIIAIVKKEKAISLGNLIGSNIFNILAVLGITSMITPIPVVDERLLTGDLFWMLGISFIILPLVFIPKGYRLNWKDGCLLLMAYFVFIYNTL